MQELTDAMLANEMGSSMAIIIILPIILFVIIFLVLIRCFLLKKKEMTKKKKIFYMISMIITASFLIFCILNTDNLYERGKNSNWYLTDNTIIDKYKDYDYTEGQNRTYYYVLTDDKEEFHVTKGEYERFQIGDNMYVLRYSDGSGNNIYSMEEYIYKGNRLKE